MSQEPIPLDVSAIPDLVRLAREVAESGTARMLRDRGADLAVLAPAARPRLRNRRSITQSDVDAAAGVAGAWATWMEPETFKRERRELQMHDRSDAAP